MARRTRDYSQELQNAFARWESTGFSDIKDWVTKGNPAKYKGGLVSFSNKLQKAYLVRKDIQKASNYGDVEVIQKKIGEFNFPEPTTVDEFNKLKDYAETSKGVETKLTKLESIESLRSLKADASNLNFRKDEINNSIDEAIKTYEIEIGPAKEAFKTAETKEERIEAQKVLKKEAGRILGGIRSGEKRRAGAAFRSIL